MVGKAPPQAVRSYLHVWLAAAGLLVVLAAILVFTPLRPCPDCEGTGKPFEEPTGACTRCEGTARLSLYRKRTTSPQRALVGAVDHRDMGAVAACLKPAGIVPLPSSLHLGILEFHADSPQSARRARELLAQDADEKKYGFWCPGRPSPWGPK